MARPMTKALEDTPKVLVVDDTKANLVAFSRVLSKLDVTVETASSGTEALSAILRHEFAAILMDVQMPEMDGYETAALIRDHTDGRPVPIIFVTAGDRSEANEFQGYESGAIDYLFKPVSDTLLLSKVRVLADLYRHRRELADAAAALQRANGQLTGLLQAAAEGIFGLSPTGIIDFVNPAACRLIGASPAELIGKAWLSFASEELRKRIGSNFETSELRNQVLRNKLYRNTQTHFVTNEGEKLPVGFSLSAVYGGSETATGYVLVFTDISDQLQAQELLRHSAEHDDLTGLANRRVYRRRLEQWTSEQRSSDSRFALLYLDLDRFKPINDQFGHKVGDVLLKNLAWRMSKALRADDLLARVGGDEFVALVRHVAEPSVAQQIAEKLRDAIEQPIVVDGLELECGVSIGVALFPDHGLDADALVRNADAAMYKAKESRDHAIVMVDAAIMKLAEEDGDA